ncbi:MAG: alanine--glyoxylate aminotransferase family protein [Acidobacteria bacterium]|nr:alanine--glyoxylate aminotransferase family protein [Acidobacteriota bacterium]
MSRLPESPRILLGPGPSMVLPSVMAAMRTPVLSHLDSDLMDYMDELRRALAATFRAPAGSFCFAVSGTGTSAMETAVANLVGDNTRVLAIVGGYFADRIAGISQRYGGDVQRLEYGWGRAVDPAAVRQALESRPADIVTVVHAETSTGVLNPIREIAAIAREHGALTIVDAVTSLGGHPLEMEQWGIDCCYSCAQKCIGAPSGVAPIAFAPTALAKRVKARSFYFDLSLLEDYWLRRKYHHTICASMLYPLGAALADVAEEGLEARWTRHHVHHLALAAGLSRMGLSLLPPEQERLWTLNAVNVPQGVDELAVRKQLLERHDIEIGAGLGPLAGKIWRVGLMGACSTPAIIDTFLSAFESVLGANGFPVTAGAGAGAAGAALAGK